MDNIDKLIEIEYSNLMNESFKKIFAGAALMYALTAPYNQSDSQVEYSSNIRIEKLDDIMKNIADKYPDKAKYTSFQSTDIENDIKSYLNSNPELQKLPYTMTVVKNGNNEIVHILSGDVNLIKSFKNKFLLEK